jgi:NAD(P)-dependent dehydrogenase (short-subunit alcohol dehydrogenase family)
MSSFHLPPTRNFASSTAQFAALNPLNMSNNLTAKIALVTGGNSGIGYTTAEALKAQGATVIITGRRPEALENAAATLGVKAIVADQASLPALQALAKQVAQGFGKVDILFINAGIVGYASIAEASEAQFDELMTINFKGAFFTLQQFMPLLSDGASVIFLGSTTGKKPLAGAAVYAASKAALHSLSQSAAIELAPRKIRVNVVVAGLIDTDIMSKGGLDEQALHATKEAYVTTKILLQKIGQPRDAAQLVTFLAGDSSAYLTGAEIILDGGAALS